MAGPCRSYTPIQESRDTIPHGPLGEWLECRLWHDASAVGRRAGATGIHRVRATWCWVYRG